MLDNTLLRTIVSEFLLKKNKDPKVIIVTILTNTMPLNNL